MSLYQFGFKRISHSVAGSSSSTSQSMNTPSHMPAFEMSGLGRVEYDESLATVSDLADPSPLAKKRKLRGMYTKYSPKARAMIGKYASINGNERARKHFLNEFPNLTESSVRNFKKAYNEKLKYEQKHLHPQPVTELPLQPRGCPPIMLDLDEKLIKFLHAIRNRGGVINIHVVRASAKALIDSNITTHHHLSRFSMPRSWVYSLYRRMGLTRRMGTTSRPPVPRGLYEECRFEFLRDVKEAVIKHNIPPQLVLNSDQTPSSYVSVGNKTMAARGSNSVPIKGLTDKRNITLNFVISLSGEFLPLQIIYGGKTNSCHPRGISFPKGFCVSHNLKHWSNEDETIKLLDEVVYPYIKKKQVELNLPESQKVLMIWDVFRGQMTTRVKDKLESLNIVLVTVPANMTHFFQPLDLTVNASAKKFMRKQFTEYYSQAVRSQLVDNREVEDIEVDLRLTSIKPLHAQWLINMYNHLCSTDGASIILKGWKKSGICDVLDGSSDIPSEDPFIEV